jgi:hypothetical protein
MLGIFRDQYLNSVCLTLSRTISPQFINIDQIQNKRSIGAATSTCSHLGGGVKGKDKDNIANRTKAMQANICE